MRTNRVLNLLLLLVLGLAAAAQAPELPPRGDDADRASKNGRTEGSIDGVDIIVTYGRPQVKGRVVWGGLVGYDGVWRSGANEATVIWFSRDVNVEGKKLAKGAYSLWTIPTKGEWTVIFNTTTKVWGTGYSSAADNDALRVKVTPKLGEHIEEMEFIIAENRVVLRWEKLATGFTVAAAE